MALLAGAMCGVRNDSCFRKHKYARTSHGMASESLSRGVDLLFAKEFCFFKQEHGPPRGSKQAKIDVLLTTVLGPLRWGVLRPRICTQKVKSMLGWRGLHWPLTRPWKRRRQVTPSVLAVFPPTAVGFGGIPHHVASPDR